MGNLWSLLRRKMQRSLIFEAMGYNLRLRQFVFTFPLNPPLAKGDFVANAQKYTVH